MSRSASGGPASSSTELAELAGEPAQVRELEPACQPSPRGERQVLRLAALAQHIRREMMVTRIYASWNQLDWWFRQIALLRYVA
jgi:hypothetical protein